MIIGALASALDSRRGIGGGVSGNKCQRESLVGKTSHDVVGPLCVLPMLSEVCRYAVWSRLESGDES